MTPEVQVDADLAERATLKATERGETVEEVIARALRAYITPTESLSPEEGTS